MKVERKARASGGAQLRGRGGSRPSAFCSSQTPTRPLRQNVHASKQCACAEEHTRTPGVQAQGQAGEWIYSPGYTCTVLSSSGVRVDPPTHSGLVGRQERIKAIH